MTSLKKDEKTVDFDCKGKATDGHRYSSISALWDEEHAPSPSSSVPIPDNNGAATDTEEPMNWYGKSEAYWAIQKASVQGMLGGLGELHERDIKASRRFISGLPVETGKGTRVLDVGAGIGRVTKHLLLGIFESVDMLEQSLTYLDESITYIPGPPHPPISAVVEGMEEGGDVGTRMAAGMQEFKGNGFKGRDGMDTGVLSDVYNLIWIQWTIGYLTDDDFVSFLNECCKALKDAGNGIIVVKDNVARTGFIVDKADSSVMRSHRYMLHLFQRADLDLMKHERQTDFPKGIHPVRMYALRPSK